MHALADKVAIITGASSGIGYAAAKLFAREGAKVVINARRREELESLAGEIRDEGGEAAVISGDVQEEELAASLVSTAMSRFGGLDIAFNNAGALGQMGAVSELSLAGWYEALDTNLTSAFLAAKYQIPAMVERGGGSVIFTSTFVGHTAGMPGMAAYAASKAGLIGLTQVLAAEYGGNGIRVNAILPGGTDTPMGRVVANNPEIRAHVASLHALGRIAHPDEIARTVLHLASDAASFITGAAILVDGGVSIYRPAPASSSAG